MKIAMMEITVNYQIGDEEEKRLQALIEKYQEQGLTFSKESMFEFIMMTSSIHDIGNKLKFHEEVLNLMSSKEPSVSNFQKSNVEMKNENAAINVYDIIDDSRKKLVDTLIAQMEKGYAATRAAWTQSGMGRPYNPVSQNHYKGGNRFRLMIAAEENGFQDPRWMTFKQAAENNYRIKAGSKSVLLEKWIYSKEVPVVDENQNPVYGSDGKQLKEWKKLEHPIPNYFRVFNGEQIEGLPELEKKVLTEDKYSEMAERFEHSSKCPIHYTNQDRAYYSPVNDEINLPSKNAFKNNETRLSVLLHEMAHSTGHPDRLNRQLKNTFGTPEYAKEELNAELSSLFLESELGIKMGPDSEMLKDHSNYVKSWISALKENPNELFHACNRAEQITEYLIENYYQELSREVTEKQQIEDMVSKVHSYAHDMFENVVSDLEKTGVWGAWVGHIVNHSNPNEYFNIDMTGVERTQEILLDISCIKDNKMVHSDSFSVKALDIWKTGTKAFDEKPIEDTLKKSLEIGKFTLDAENGHISFDIYSTLANSESLEKHRELLEASGKSLTYFTDARISGDIIRSGFKATESLVENIHMFSEMEGKDYTLREIAVLSKSKPDFSKEPKKAECFANIVKECQEQELAKEVEIKHFMKQEMMIELTPTLGA